MLFYAAGAQIVVEVRKGGSILRFWQVGIPLHGVVSCGLVFACLLQHTLLQNTWLLSVGLMED